jgi:homocysteine S-methyltransferase
MQEANEALLARMGGGLWLTDGGLETTLVFHQGLELPEFASFPLIGSEDGRARLRDYYASYIGVARELDMGFLLGTPTWRASHGWGARLGFDRAAIAALNAEAVGFAAALRDEAGQGMSILINAEVGPAGDAYRPDALLTAEEAEAYHFPQMATLSAAGADMVTVLTMTHPGEAIGAARAAARAGLPAAISFTVETDGRLVCGLSLGEAVAEVEAATGGSPLWYQINCAHPEHFRDALRGAWVARIGGLRANASRLSHAELEASETLDDGDPEALARDHVDLLDILPGLRVLGGCCGTDLRHVGAIGAACAHHHHAHA